jgi:hypothetical protein
MLCRHSPCFCALAALQAVAPAHPPTRAIDECSALSRGFSRLLDFGGIEVAAGAFRGCVNQNAVPNIED